MATRIKTVEYFLGARNTSLAAATRHNFAQVSVRLPETSKTFRTARIIVQCRDTATAATSLTSPLIGVQIDAVAFSDATLGSPPGNTGESGQYVFERDVTSYFQTNFTGAAHNVGVGVSFAGVATINHCVKIILTYEYEDTSAEHVKTVRIPIESTVGALTATLAAVGTDQIPALDTTLPEAGKTYRRVWLEAYYNETTVGTANDAALGVSVGGQAEQLTGAHESGLASSCAGWYCFDQGATPAWSTASAQALQARSTNITTASTFEHVAFVLYVTYTFDPAATTRVLNSLALLLPPIFTPGATTSADESVQEMALYIEEPGTITLRQSGMLLAYSQIGAVGPRVRAGAQAHRSYTDSNMLFCGSSFLTQRIDSGGAQGAGITLARGKVTFAWGCFIATAGVAPSTFDGFLYLNYESDKSALGVGVHNQSLCFSVQDSQASGVVSTITAAPYVRQPSTHWYRNAFGFLSNQVMGTTASAQSYNQFEAESLAGELSGGGWENQGCIPLAGESELGWYPVSMNVGLQSPNDWRRYSGDVDTARMDPLAPRRFRTISGAASTRPLSIWTTMHNIVFAVGGTVAGSAGGTVTLNLCRASDGARLKQTTRVGNGAYTFDWYDNTEPVFVEARESDTLLGRSAAAVATGNP